MLKLNCGGAHGVIVTVVENGYSEPSSKPGRGGCLHLPSINPIIFLPAMSK